MTLGMLMDNCDVNKDVTIMQMHVFLNWSKRLNLEFYHFGCIKIVYTDDNYNRKSTSVFRKIKNYSEVYIKRIYKLMLIF